MVIVDVIYYPLKEIVNYQDLFSIDHSSSGHLSVLAKSCRVHVFRNISQQTEVVVNGANYHFYNGSSLRFWLPFKLNKKIKSLNPTLIVLHGFYNPIQSLLLSFQLKVPIVIQYNGGGEPKGFNGFLQKIVKHRINNYIFTAKEQAESFIKLNLICKNASIHEILEGSTHFKEINKTEARKKLEIKNDKLVFLWVGRLIENKDPLTVIKGLLNYFTNNQNAELYLIYQDDTLLEKLNLFLAKYNSIKNQIKFIGKIPHTQLDTYYSAADYFVSGSFYEGSGYSLFESMACGCVPLVTDIPSFRKITNDGTIGKLWHAGDSKNLESSLEFLLKKNIAQESKITREYFVSNLSFEAIAKKYLELIHKLQ